MKPTGPAAKISWRQVDAADVLSGMSALRDPKESLGAIYDYLVEPEVYLEWAESELDEIAADSTTESRKCSNAVSHAKRAIDAMFDAYLQGSWLDSKLRSRAMFSEKCTLLERLFRERFPGTLVEQTIATPRNDSEHQYHSPTKKEARLALDAARAVVTALPPRRDPLKTPVLSGRIPNERLMSSDGGSYAHFKGIKEDFAVTRRCSDSVIRAGVGTRISDLEAEIIYAELSAFSVDQLFELIDWWDKLEMSTAMDVGTLDHMFANFGLDIP